jgi:multiple sugar transport system substrate-binding protein
VSSPSASRTTLTRRRALGLLGGAAAGAGLAGCSPGGPGGDEVKFMYYGDAQSLPRYQKLFADFNQLHPEIKLKASNVPADNWAGFANAITTRIAGGLSPDIVDIATEGQRIFSSKGLLEPLDFGGMVRVQDAAGLFLVDSETSGEFDLGDSRLSNFFI